MSELLQMRGVTVELPTAAGWVRPVNGVSLGLAPASALVGGRIGEREDDVVAGVDGIVARGGPG